MTALRICSGVTPGWGLVTRCIPRVTSTNRPSIFGLTPKVSAPRSKDIAALPASLPCCFTLSLCQRDTVVGSSLSTQQAVAMPVIQDHSSFANYWQAAVTHIDLDLSVHFDSKTVGGTAKVCVSFLVRILHCACTTVI
ncbi:hypothetical protein ABBQ38_002716 [Trebouxia sp. C0009 RCD-2024]